MGDNMEEKFELQKGKELLDFLMNALKSLKNVEGRQDASEYRSYLHGQIYGLAMALKIFYPGPGNLGERAAMAVRPVIAEDVCQCTEKNNDSEIKTSGG